MGLKGLVFGFLCSSVDGDVVTRMANELSVFGVETEVISTVSEARYRAGMGGGRLVRLILRWRMMVVHPLLLFRKQITAPRGSVFFVTTNPFFLPGLAAWVGKLRGQKVVHVLFDLYPDALEATKAVRPGGMVSWTLGWFTRQALRRSFGTVFLGEELARHAESRWGSARRCWVIPGILAGSGRVAGSGAYEGEQSVRSDRKRRVEFYCSGQLGRMHDAGRLGTLVVGFRNEAGPNWNERVGWTFRVSGAGVTDLKEALSCAAETGPDATGVEIDGPLPPEDWWVRASEAALGVVSLSADGARVAFPSKAFGMMSCGLAILALCPAESDLGRLVRENACGWVVDSSEEGGAVLQERWNQTIREIVDNPEELLRRRENALKALERMEGETLRLLQSMTETIQAEQTIQPEQTIKPKG